MKKYLFASVALVLLSGSSALAADPTMAIQDLPPGFSWTGAYLGVQAGYAWGNADDNFPADPTAETDASVKGGFAGVYTGYNWQAGNIVFGVDGDINISGIDGRSSPNRFGEFIDTDVNWMGAARARVGYAMDRVLIYGAGGAAIAGVDINLQDPVGSFDTASETLTGWTLGAGAEVAFTDNMIGRAEYRYTDLGDIDYLNGTGSVDINLHTISAGVAYKF